MTEINNRNNQHLEEKMYNIWENYFDDIPRKNLVLIHFGKYSYRQLGCIRWAHKKAKIKGLMSKRVEEYESQDDKRISIITVTRYFQDLYIPDFVVDTTIAHEMSHYAHGFNSPLPQIFNHPHRGNVVDKELIKRGLGSQLDEANLWLKGNWARYVKSKMGLI